MNGSGNDATDRPYPPGSIGFEAILGEKTARLISNLYASRPGSHVKPWADLTQAGRNEAVEAVLVIRYALARAWPRAVSRTMRPDS